MPSSGLKGSYPLTMEKIDAEVTKTSAGTYALGKTNPADNLFIISYVGRADTDLNKRLKDHVGKYERFEYDYFGSPKAAYEKECRLYHDFNPPDNKVHPARLEGAMWVCLVAGCGAFD